MTGAEEHPPSPRDCGRSPGPDCQHWAQQMLLVGKPRSRPCPRSQLRGNSQGCTVQPTGRQASSERILFPASGGSNIPESPSSGCIPSAAPARLHSLSLPPPEGQLYPQCRPVSNPVGEALIAHSGHGLSLNQVAVDVIWGEMFTSSPHAVQTDRGSYPGLNANQFQRGGRNELHCHAGIRGQALA